MKIELSVVVPTKNRHYYLKYLINYFKLINSDKIELIIYDNSDSVLREEFILFLNKVNDKRINYYEDDNEMSQTENCDMAVSKAKGEYITLLGDDDIFSKHILEYIDEWRLNKVDVVLPIKGVYFWPDVKPRLYGNKQSGMFKLGLFSNKIKKIESKKVLAKVINRGGSKILNLPRIYHGIVSKELLDKIYLDIGTYFPGPSPDIANAIALSKYSKNYIIIDLPLIISGQSKLSAGGKGAAGNHYGEISKIKQLPKNAAKEWSKKVPFYWSGETIYAESTLKALEKMNMKRAIEHFNYEYLYASCLVFDIRYKYRIIKCISKYMTLFNRIKILYYFILIWVERLFFHLKNNLVLLLPKSKKLQNRVFYENNTFDIAIINDSLIKDNFNK